jgi:hypothetical protein
MRILIYKRTHTGDPNSAGKFGINGCMGLVRSWNFDAVIGVGGYGSEPRSYGIEGRVNWVGLNPTWTSHPQGHGLLVTFEWFSLYEDKGPMLHQLAPLLARRMYEKKARVLFKSYSPQEKAEAEVLIYSLFGQQPSVAVTAKSRRSRCRANIVCKPCRPAI